jgi:hypothetical protein
LIEDLLGNGTETFKKIGKTVLDKYFTKPTEENLKLFL